MTIEIGRYKSINRTDVMPCYYKAMLDLLENGLSGYWYFTQCKALKAIVAKDNDKLIGFIAYDYNDAYLSIYLGWVDIDYRGKGIYKQMYNDLVVVAKDLNMVQIDGWIHKDNESVIKVMEKLGRVPEHIQYVHYLKDNKEEKL